MRHWKHLNGVEEPWSALMTSQYGMTHGVETDRHGQWWVSGRSGMDMLLIWRVESWHDGFVFAQSETLFSDHPEELE